MIVIGLTGSIAMGKSTTAQMIRSLGIPVHDADAAVHSLQAAGGAAVVAIAERFGDDVLTGGAVDRAKLGPKVLGKPDELKALEAIIHPLVRAKTKAFLRNAQRSGHRRAVLDIPLLFETGAEARVDAVWVVSASAVIQRQRVLSRAGMTPEKLTAILARQTPDAEKRRRADAIIPTGAGRAVTYRALVSALAQPISARAWPSAWGGIL